MLWSNSESWSRVPNPPPTHTHQPSCRGTQHDRTPYCVLYWLQAAASPNIPLRRQLFWRGFRPPIFLTWTRLSLMCGPSRRIGKTDRVNMGLLSCCQIHSLTSRLVTQNTFNGIKSLQVFQTTATRGDSQEGTVLSEKPSCWQESNWPCPTPN